MTLHEAIEIILQETGRPMSTREIADVVNKRNLYTRRDGLPISASQIAARVGNYENLFIKEQGKIKLVKDDIVSFMVQNYKSEISKIDIQNLSVGGQSRILLDVLTDLKEVKANNSEKNIIEESISDTDILKIYYKVFHWHLLQNSQSSAIISDGLAGFLSGLEWFKQGKHNIWTDFKHSIHYLFKIAYKNPRSIFTVSNKQEGFGSYNEDLSSKVTNRLVEDAVNKLTFNDTSNKESAINTGIFIPPFLHKKDLEREAILTKINFDSPEFDKAIIILPASSLFSKRKDEQLFREKIVKSGYLDSVIQFSMNAFENTSINIGVLILDFSRKNNKVFFLDESSENSFASAKAVNEKIEEQGVSRSVLLNDIITNDFNLIPNRYVFDFKIGPLEPGIISDKIENLILDKKRGKHISNKKSLYIGGEYKIIRTSNINDDASYFKPSKTILGIDHDQLPNIDRHLVRGGIVLSGFNKKLKANILPEDEAYIIGQDTYWIKLNNEKILDEYFIQELAKNYVRTQVVQSSKGRAIMRLNLKDFLQIQIKYPSPEEQKNLILQEMRNVPKEVDEVDLSEIDFINTLEHSLKQPASGLGSDLASLRTFIKKKVESGEGLSMEESVVPLFSTDTPEQIAIHTLSNTLERMHRAITDIDYILRQAKDLASASATPAKEYIETKSFLNNFIAEYKDITFKFSSNVDIMADRKQLRILFQNFIENANRHGFSEAVAKPTIWIDVKNKNELEIQIFIRNNGKALAPEFKIEDFLAKGESSNEEVGSGFGGYLIGQILKNHKGSIQLTKKIDFELAPHNVEFIITLPK